ncbi:Similar to hypothetical protein SS1G_04343 [Sclerotinia sclerotiorum 1980]; acc. no. XP_001594536 [Pyronema omphalodes CBS 100304]|uniref:Uncharacterized protein n=1 Tax=Pyronema omphalodes (strain CBS 100304) TaxID=1076935 RepID=U4LGU8_PYROM|nr:Similar to hypothetical protein SS1G_04343 [Sclerotinia sclerotiorum 1980]; acc. no. XP_001594536 [Pyronema omphalodes CBS 100304]
MLHTVSGDVLLRRFLNRAEQWNMTLGRSLSPGGGMVFSEKTGLYGVYFGISAPGASGGKEVNGTQIKMLSIDSNSVTSAGASGARTKALTVSTLLSTSSSSSKPACVINTDIITSGNGSFESTCLDINNGLWMGDTNLAAKTVPGDVEGNFNKLARFPGEGELYVMAYLVGTGDGTSDSSSTSSAALGLANVGISLLSPANSLHISTLLTSASLSASETNLNPRVCPITSTQALVTYETFSNGRFLGTNLQILNASGEKIGSAKLMKGMRISGDIVSTGGNGQSAKLCWPYVMMPSGASDAAEPRVQFMCAVLGGGNTNNPPNIPPIKSGEPPATDSGRSPAPTGIPTQPTKVTSTPTTKATPTSETEKTTVIANG